MDNNIKKKLREQIKNCRRKMNLAKCIDCGICFAAAGGILGIFCEIFSLYRQFFYVHFAAWLCFFAGCLAGSKTVGFFRIEGTYDHSVGTDGSGNGICPAAEAGCLFLL